jgi:putative oxidoreductase
MSPSRLASWQPEVLSVLRIIIGFTFCEHGLQKALGLLGGHAMPPLSLLGVAGWLELVGGLLILVGWFTRPAAFILCGEMAVGYFKQHAPAGFWPIVNHGELAVLYCFVYLYLFFAGPGRWSVDTLIRKKG